MQVNIKLITIYNFREISAEAILDLDIFNLSSDKTKRSSSAGRRGESDEEEDMEDSSPLFWQPGKRGYYAPRVGKTTPERINAYRNVGRYVSIAWPVCRKKI